MRVSLVAVKRVSLATALAAALGACHHADRLLDEPGLQRQLHALASLSAEAALVADEAHAGHLTAAYIRAHLGHLLEDVADARQQLARPAPASLAPRQQAAQALAAQLARALAEIAVAPSDTGRGLLEQERLAKRLKGEFDALGTS